MGVNKKISELTAATALSGNEKLPFALNGANGSMTAALLKSHINLDAMVKKHFVDAAHTFAQFLGWLSNASANTGQPTCSGVVKFAVGENPLYPTATIITTCHFLWFGVRDDGANNTNGYALLYPCNYESNVWGIVQRVQNSWLNAWTVTGNIQQSNNAWSGTNTFAEGKLKIGTSDVTARKRYTYNTATVTIASLDDNSDYVFNQPVTLLTINAVEVSTLETSLFLTTGTTIPVINIPASIKRIGEVLFEPDTQYIVTFRYGTVEVKKAV